MKKRVFAWISALALSCAFSVACDKNDGEETDGLDISASVGGVNKTGVYYETQITFYVNPVLGETESESVYVYSSYSQEVLDHMVALLESEFFAERLLSDDISTEERFTEIEKITLSTGFSNKKTEQGLSFIYVSLSVLDDKDYAENLRLSLIETVPEYVEENMPIPQGYCGTNCERSSRMDEVQAIVYKDGKKAG